VQEQDRAYIELLLHIMREMKSLGFKVITLIAGHYPLRNHATAAAEWFNVICRPTRAWATSGYDLVRDEIPEAGDHAAAWETSLMMAMRPELVDMSVLPQDLAEPLIGVGGRDPREHASVEFGQRGVEAVVKAITAHTHELLATLE
jgi:creatinine amidohydrolase/Fe(II)-dependent formamide hydrolase-like protein